MTNRLKYAFYCYIFLMVLIIICKPKIMFQNNGVPKQFGTGGEEKTIFPFWLAAILGAIFSYIASINVIFRMDHSDTINKNNPQNDYFHQDKKYPMIISGGNRQTFHSNPTPSFNMTGGGDNSVGGVSVGSDMNNVNELRQNLFYQQPQYGGYYQYHNQPNNNLHWNKAWN